MRLNAWDYLVRLAAELSRVDLAALDRLSGLLYRAWETGKFVFVFGNGGSGATASHMSEDLGKSLLKDAELRDETKKRLRILSLTDNTAWIMAVANDLEYEQVFVQQLMNYGSRGDVVVAISGSGDSPNVLAAVDWANRHGLVTFGLSGYDGGKLKKLQQDGLHVDLEDMGMVESIHLCVFHWVADDLHARIHGQGRRREIAEQGGHLVKR